MRGLLCIRFEEVFVFTAIPLFGYLTAILSVAGHATVSSSLLVFLGSFCTMAGTFLINDYAGLKEDKQDQSKKHQPSIRLKARGGELLMAFLFTSFLGTISFASLGKTIAAKKTLVVTSMGFVYSNPVQTCQVKRIPFFATLMHVVGAVFSFQLGFSAVGAVHRGIDYIGLYIGFLVAGGHFLQEIHDNDGDSMNKIPTTAVLLGVERTFFLAATFFTTANVFIFGIVQQKWVSLGGASWAILCLWVSTCFFTVIHFYLVWSTGLTQTDIHRLRKKTRATILPLMMALTMIVEPGFRLRTESSLMTSDSLPSWDLGNQGALSNITEKVSSDLGVEIEKVTMKNIATEDELVSILVPVFNEASTVESTVLSLAVVSHPHEVIIINDGSTDETFSILNSSAPLWKEKIPMLQELRIIQLASNRGKGMAIREGFKVSKGSIIVLQDADAEYNADDIIILITPLLLEPEVRIAKIQDQTAQSKKKEGNN